MTFRIRFAKYGVVKFIGHLDVMRYFQKVVRRSELPVKYSQGFNPHQLLTFAQPLGVGITSDGEYMEIEFDDDRMLKLANVEAIGTRDIGNGLTVLLTADKDAPKLEKLVFDELSRETYEGFSIVAVKLLPPPKANTKVEKAMALVSGADYMVSLKDGYSMGFESPEAFEEAFVRFASQKEITVTKKTKKNENEINIRQYIYAAGGAESFDTAVGTAHADAYESGQRVFMRLAAGSIVNIRPELLMEAFCESIGKEYASNMFQVHRLETYMGNVGHFKSMLG